MPDEQVTDETRATGTRDRSALTWTVGAIVLLAILGAVAFALIDGDDDSAPTPGSAGPGETARESVTRLTVEAEQGRCQVPNAQTLSQQEIALDGVVESVTEGEATLRPRRFYTGEETDLVLVRTTDRRLPLLFGSLDLREGQRYLIAATDGRVVLCGFSDQWSQDLADLYGQAFAG